MQERCGAKTRSGAPCKNYGMKNGRCRMHGGMSTGRPIIHGRYSIKHKQSLNEKYHHFREDPEPANLMDELALQRALLQDFIDRLGDGLSVSIVMRKHVFDMVEDIGKLIERVTRIINQTALTTAEVDFLQRRYVDLMIRYIPDDRVDDFWKEFEASFGVFERGGRPLITSEEISTADVA